MLIKNILHWFSKSKNVHDEKSTIEINTFQNHEKSVSELEFLNACVDARKAWHGTNMLSITKPDTVNRVKHALVASDGPDLTKLLLEIMGPVAPAQIKDAMGTMSVAHRELAGLMCSLAFRIAVLKRTEGNPVDLTIAKDLLASWITTGEFHFETEELLPRKYLNEAKKISELFKQSDQADRIRLSIVAPLAPALESMLVISKFCNSSVSNLVQMSQRESVAMSGSEMTHQAALGARHAINSAVLAAVGPRG